VADEIVSVYRMDVQQWEAGKDAIRSGSAELVANNKQTQTSFANLSKQSASAFATDKVKQFSNEAGKALKDVKKETDNLTKSTGANANGFVALNTQLKAVKGQLATLAASGRENGKLFKALSAEAGSLKDRMASLSNTINLASEDTIPGLSSGFEQLKGGLLTLDFGAATRGISALTAGVGKLDLKSLSSSLGGVVQGLGKLAGAIFSSPLFLIAGAIAGIVAVISTWGESLEEIRAKNDRLIAGIDNRLSVTQAGYEREIALLKASGEATDQLEKAKLRDFIKNTEIKIKLRQKEFDFEMKNSALARKILGEDKFQEVIDASEINKTLIDLQISLDDAKAGLRIVDLQKETDAKKKQDDLNKKSNEDYKKRLEEKLKIAIDAFKTLSETTRFYEQEEAARITAEGQKKIDDILAKAFPERKKKTQSALEDARDLINEETVKTAEDEKVGYEKRQEALDEAIERDLVTQQEALDLQKSITQQKIDDKHREVEAALFFAEDLVSIATNLAQIARNLGMENAEAEKAFAVFGVAVNLAQSLANIVTGATTAALATGPLAPFTLIGYIASGTAAVLGAFAQITGILNQEPPSFAEGGYTGDGGKYEEAGTVHKGEFVTTKEDTKKHRTLLEGIHEGNPLMIKKGIQELIAGKGIMLESDLTKKIQGQKEDIRKNEIINYYTNDFTKLEGKFDKTNEMMNKLVDSQKQKTYFDAKGNLVIQKGSYKKIIRK